MIHLEEVSVRYQGSQSKRPAVDGLNLSIEPGETLCLIGPSGCGKTTTLRLINRLVEPSEGTVRIDGVDVATMDEVRLRRGIGYVIQSGGLFPHMDVRANIGLLPALEGWDASRIEARVEELLRLVRLDPATHGARFPSQLSGGEAQRVGVARALALDPQILLMDEPFGALDPLTRTDLQAEFRELQNGARTVVLVTHDMEEAFALGDRIGILEEGKLVQVGSRAELERAPKSRFVERFLESRPRA